MRAELAERKFSIVAFCSTMVAVWVTAVLIILCDVIGAPIDPFDIQHLTVFIH